MARIESVCLGGRYCDIAGVAVEWSINRRSKQVDILPQVFWTDGNPWREANLWAFERAFDNNVEALTVLAEITTLASYATWLELNDLEWIHFPDRKMDRCLFRYRGDLIEARDAGRLAPSTTSERMRVVISFYRWARSNGLLSQLLPLWRDKSVRISQSNLFGIARTYTVLSSELAIPNRKSPSDAPENGLMPVSSNDRDEILRFALEKSSIEIFLLLSLGFFTGMRLGTLSDLKIETLENALPDPRCEDLFRLHIGPGARPPVATKFGITGFTYIPRILLNQLRAYVEGTRRLLRETKAKQENRRLVFLTKHGNPYAQRGVDKSVAVNVEMHALRKKATAAGMEMACTFKFHQTRATFGTELARLALKYANATEAISMVKEALLQRSELSALHYIRFVERTPIKIEIANEFTRSFIGAFEEKK
ncbi:site-specific integrase [Herbaspirillum frisingense]|nr:site-specific integrase [Herbaspirillum frisingense]